ncbi:restriction endonuclease subunit S [Sporofaciens musculi]|uniref:restriction endonuclease subunit S n=1 Tax=Sporofaciens musculi TaxID=2681861 RepID=UPI002583DF0C|nr:restriction endonuclease subunit S [Sporofaciens musculi]
MGKPKIRFKGFTEDWEQSKLEDLCNFINGDRSSNYPNATDFQVNGIPFVGSDSLGMTYINKNKLRFISTEKYFQMKGLKIQKGDILYTLRGAGFGKCSISDFSEGTIASSLVGIRCSELLKSLFLIQWLNSTNAENEKKKAVNGSTAQNISVEDMKLYIVYIPTIEEQEKISEYLLNLDNLITLHQRKCDETKKLKKYMLQKMFPQNGMKVPEIRLEGFTGDWEQRKLGEICLRVQGNDGRMELPTLTISAGNGWMRQEDRFSGNIAGKELKNYTLLRKGELSYNHGNSKLAKYGAVFSLQTYEEALVPRVYHSFKVIKGNADFVEYYFATKLLDRELGKLISSGARMDGLLNIGYDEFMGIPLMVPTTEEQMKIAIYFRNLDHLITLHQQKCDKLMKIKKYMLQNMFV